MRSDKRVKKLYKADKAAKKAKRDNNEELRQLFNEQRVRNSRQPLSRSQMNEFLRKNMRGFTSEDVIANKRALRAAGPIRAHITPAISKIGDALRKSLKAEAKKQIEKAVDEVVDKKILSIASKVAKTLPT